jgi:hypothetical protein
MGTCFLRGKKICHFVVSHSLIHSSHISLELNNKWLGNFPHFRPEMDSFAWLNIKSPNWWTNLHHVYWTHKMIVAGCICQEWSNDNSRLKIFCMFLNVIFQPYASWQGTEAPDRCTSWFSYYSAASATAAPNVWSNWLHIHKIWLATRTSYPSYMNSSKFEK